MTLIARDRTLVMKIGARLLSGLVRSKRTTRRIKEAPI